MLQYHMRTFLIACLASASAQTAEPWLHLGPGGGGQIQDVVCDPLTPGRLFIMSDVDGLYESRDGGGSWHNLHQGVVMYHARTLRVHPSDADTAYLGTWWGLQITRDGGRTWTLTGEAAHPGNAAYALRNNLIGALAVTAAAPDRVWAANGWGAKGDNQFATYDIAMQSPSGPREVFWSEDAGATWQRSAYAAGDGYRNVFDLVADPADPATVWVAASAGLHRGVIAGGTMTWTRIAPPPGVDAIASGDAAGRAVCYGADLSPDGVWIYATFTLDLADEAGERVPLSLPFAALVTDLLAANDGSAWHALADATHRGELPVLDDDTAFSDGSGTDTQVNYAQPRVDPRSTPGQHRVLLAHLMPQSGGAHGLMEGVFTIGAGAPSGSWLRVQAQNGATQAGGTFAYDPGWNPLTSRATGCAYVPATWDGTVHGGQTIIAIAGQNAYRGSSASRFTSWNNIGTTRIAGEPGTGTYANRGATCTVDFELSRHGQRILVAMADNGLVESADGGASWRGSPFGLGHGDACLVVPLDDPVLLASLVPNSFGGATADAVTDIHGRRASGAAWQIVAGGATGLAGWRRSVTNPAGMRPTCLAYAPTRPQRIAAAHMYGISVCEDAGALVDGTGGQWASAVSGSSSQRFRDVVFDPSDAARLYYLDSDELVTLTYDGSTWTPAETIAWPAEPSDLSVWRHGGKLFRLIATADERVHLQIDDGAWQVVLDRAILDAATLAAGNTWYSQLLAHFAGDASALPLSLTCAGTEDIIIVGSAQHAFRRGSGTLLGRIAADGSVAWRDWTGDPEADGYLYKSFFRSLRVQREGDDLVCLAASSGAGSWMRVVAPRPVVTSTASASGQVGLAFVHDLTASGTPTAFAATNLPPGLILNPQTGRVAGTPTQAGSWTLSVQVDNETGSGTATLLITIAAASDQGNGGASGVTGGGGGGCGSGFGVSAALLLAMAMLLKRRVS
jgi:hypothetical protein